MLKLSFFSLFIYVRYLKTAPSALEMIEIIFTMPLTIYKSSEPINSALFSRAKRSPRLLKFVKRSPRLVNLNSFNFDLKRWKTRKGFCALFGCPPKRKDGHRAQRGSARPNVESEVSFVHGINQTDRSTN